MVLRVGSNGRSGVDSAGDEGRRKGEREEREEREERLFEFKAARGWRGAGVYCSDLEQSLSARILQWGEWSGADETTWVASNTPWPRSAGTGVTARCDLRQDGVKLCVYVQL